MFFRSRIYGNKAINKARDLVTSALETKIAEETLGGFFTLAMPALQSAGYTAEKLFTEYRKRGFDTEKAAICFIDGTVTAIKHFQSRTQLDQQITQELTKLVSNLERVLDIHAPARMIVVRNGKWGQGIGENMSEYFSA